MLLREVVWIFTSDFGGRSCSSDPQVEFHELKRGCWLTSPWSCRQAVMPTDKGTCVLCGNQSSVVERGTPCDVVLLDAIGYVLDYTEKVHEPQP